MTELRKKLEEYIEGVIKQNNELDMRNKQYLSETQELGRIITQLTQRVNKTMEQMATLKNVEVCHDDIEKLELRVKKLEVEPRIVVYKRGVSK